MTRINVGVPPKELHRLHLIAEHREIVRIPNLLKARLEKINKGIPISKIVPPKEFKLGTGHVIFFYDKMLYLKNRYVQLYNEMIARGYNPTNMVSAFDNIPPEYNNDYVPTETAIKLIRERISLRLNGIK